MSGFKEKRSVCLWNRGVNREFNRDEEGMVEAEWEEEYKKKTQNKRGRVFKSTTVRETHKREKKVWVGKHSTERGDRCRNREREERFRESQRGKKRERERQEDEVRVRMQEVSYSAATKRLRCCGRRGERGRKGAVGGKKTRRRTNCALIPANWGWRYCWARQQTESLGEETGEEAKRSRKHRRGRREGGK